MITINKLNEIQAEVLAEGMPFAMLEKPTGVGYKLYLTNRVIEFTEAEGKNIVPFCEKLYIKQRSRQRRTFIKEHKLRNSILKGNYNILE
jgi:hypothetical protein